MPFWIQAIPRQKHSWIIAPTGRTSWVCCICSSEHYRSLLLRQGFDWHGPSSVDAWSSVDALYEILSKRDTWRAYKLVRNSRVLFIGHSNGGQGAWWNAGRHPDRVVAGTFNHIDLEN